MKSAHLFCLVVCLLFAAFVHAEDAQEVDDPVKLEQMKQLVLKDVKKACAPQRKQSDQEWEKMIMSSEANQMLVKNAVVAMKRNNLDGYWDAVSRVDCMEDY
ncbi:MAG: YicS family protein [Leclercia sp.]